MRHTPTKALGYTALPGPGVSAATMPGLDGVRDKGLSTSRCPEAIVERAIEVKASNARREWIDMQRGETLIDQSALELPEGYDPSGIPLGDPGTPLTRHASSHRRHRRPLPGLSPTTRIASIEQLAAQGPGDWLIWASIDDRPALIAVEPRAAAEMVASVTSGHCATAIIEPWQVVLEPLD